MLICFSREEKIIENTASNAYIKKSDSEEKATSLIGSKVVKSIFVLPSTKK